MKIQLTEVEKEIGALVGMARFNRAKKDNLPDRIGMPLENQEKYDINGAQAEFAFCKLLGCFWNTDMNIFKGADVGKDIQIRATEYPAGSLMVYDVDNSEDVYILAIHSAYGIDFRGMIKGSEAKQEKYFTREIRGKRLLKACYVISQQDLNPFTLTDLVRIKSSLRNL